jgi:hypothetical protein
MTLEQLRDEAIRLGIEACHRDYNRPDQANKKRGAIAGFERCRHIPIHPEYYEAELAQLEEKLQNIRGETDPADYWETRCYQAEIQWMFEVLKVAWRKFPLSARAAMTYNNILGGGH